MSQTADITYYYVDAERGLEETFNICIIDTPGFGYTVVAKDNEIVKKLKTFFKDEVSEIDYILLTVKASTTRWTQANIYIYDFVQEIFGKDASDRFVLMCTFSDGQKTLGC